MAVTMDITVLWDVALCSLVEIFQTNYWLPSTVYPIYSVEV
jgi:hypothetical protein